jgi:hypothetical protein
MFTQPSVNQIASTYATQPAPLARKVDQDKKQNGGIPKDLRQLMALNDIAAGKNAVGIQQALQIPTNMPTVAQSTQQLAQQAIQARMLQQAREQQRLQQQPPVLPPGTPQPKEQPQGIDTLSANVGEAYAEGGIIGHTQHFQSKGAVKDPLATEEEATSQGGDLIRSLLNAIGGGIQRTVDYGKLKSQSEEARPGFFESLTPTQRAERLKQAALLRTQMGQVADTGEAKVPYPEAGKPTYDRPVGQDDFDRESNKLIRQTPGVRAAEIAAPAVKPQTQSIAAPASNRVNAPEAPGITSALPPAQTEAYKKLTEMMNQDPEVKAQALRDRYNKEVGARDLSIYDKTAAELEARKNKLNAPKAGYDAMMEYLEQIAIGGGRSSAESGALGAARQRQLQLSRQGQQNELMDKILELGAKKSDAQFAEKKGMFEMTQKEREDIFKKAFDAAKSVNASDDEAKKLAAQAVEKELDRKNQIRAAQIGAQDRDQLMNRAKALMAVDKTLSLEGAMQKAALAAAAGTLSVADTRANTAADATRAKIREKYSWIDMLPANDPTKKAMSAERDRALAAVGGGAGLSDAVTSTSTGKPKFLGYE